MKRVLIIDDSLTVRMDLNEVFQEAGWATALCASASEAREAIREGAYDCIILDLVLPDANGLELLREFKRNKTTAAIPVLLLSTEAEMADPIKGMGIGAEEYVGKPYDRDYVVSQAERLARQARDHGASAPGVTILAVDDSTTYLHELAEQLRKDNYTVVLARSGAEALDLLQVRPVDCILLDLVMPEMSGHVVCQRIKASPAWRFIPVVMLTGKEESDALIESFNAGADDYVAKSGDFAVLRARLRAQLRRRQFEEETRRIREELQKKEFEAAQTKVIGESEQRMQMALQINRSFAFEWEPATDRVVRSESCGPILGLEGKQLCEDTGQRYLQHVHPEDREQFLKLLGELKPGAETYHTQYRLLRDDGTTAVLEESARGFFDAAGKLRRLVGVTADITERKRAEAELQQHREWLRVTLTSIGDAVIATDTAGLITFLNPVAADLTGWQPEAALGQSIQRVFRIIGEQTRKPAEGILDSVLRQGTVSNLANHTALVSLEEREIPIEGCAAPIKDSAGTVVGVVLVFGDVTEMRRAQQALRAAKDELARSNEQLERRVQQRTAKLQELVNQLEHFSYTITHDMRAPLRAMQGFAGLMGELCAECTKSEPKEYVDLIKVSAVRMDRLITGALQYSRAGKEEVVLKPVDAAELLRGIVQSYPALQAPKARIRIDGAIPTVLGTEAELTQCFSNLLGNAVKFVPPGITPEVRVWAERVRSRECSGLSPEGSEGPSEPAPSTSSGRVRIWFEDNGIGIPKEAQSKLFRMFQRATKEFEGTGVGLALVKKVAERMGGGVGVESEEGKGSRFWLELRTGS